MVNGRRNRETPYGWQRRCFHVRNHRPACRSRLAPDLALSIAAVPVMGPDVRASFIQDHPRFPQNLALVLFLFSWNPAAALESGP